MKNGDEIFVIGYPVGIPLKVADGAKVRSNNMAAYYSTDLDTFGGNSGSPVFNAKTNLIEGILVRGGTDFERTPDGCRIYSVVGQNEGRGEDVTKISEVAPSLIPLLKGSSKENKIEIDAVSVPFEQDISVYSCDSEISGADCGNKENILEKVNKISADWH